MQNTTILNYKLTEKIGEGGFAEVWLAEHTKLGTKAAIKVLDKKIVEIEGFKDRFLRAAKLLSSLKHPHIVEIIDYDDTYKYVMILEYLDGPMFRSYINEKYNPANPLQFIPLFLQVLAAVGFIHERGVIHRDIKPTNVIIQNPNNNPKAKLLDFDIAKDLNNEHTATLTTQQMGTITYMSPEQVVSAKNIDIRSDIYSLGVMLFYVLTGKAAYSSQIDSQYQLMEKIIKQPLPDLKSINPNIPDWICDILKKSTEKEVSKRFQSCEEFAEAIKKGFNNTYTTPEIGQDRTLKFNEFKETFQKPIEPTILLKEDTQKRKSSFTYIAIIAVILLCIGGYLYSKMSKSTSDLSRNVIANQVDSLDAIPQNKKEFENPEVNVLFDEAKKAQQQKDFSKAIELYNKGLQNGDLRVYNNLGVLYAFDKGNFQKGLEYFQKAIANGDIDAMNNLGLLYFKGRRISESKAILKKAYAINKNKTSKMIMKIQTMQPDFQIFEDSNDQTLNFNPEEPKNVHEVFTAVEVQPEYEGGIREMYRFIGNNLHYPEAAQKANVSGKVFAKFIVEKDGSIKKCEILKGIGFGCDEEACRVIKAMPKWNAGKQNGQNVRVYYTLPISFTLE